MSSRYAKHKNVLFLSSALCLVAGAAFAQQEETIIVTGTRVQGMTAADSAAPITIIGANSLSEGIGNPDLRQAIGALVPSFTAQQTGGDTAELSLSAALRGLSPNDTLVLVNGQRRHYSANLHVLSGNFASGSAAPDLSLISQSAIDHIEVLQDGAAAQYGSDAIGGVVNIILKKQSTGGVVSVTGGQTYSRQGATSDVTANLGLPLFGSKGFINLTASHQTRGHTFNGGADPRLINATGGAVPVGTVGTTPNAAGVITCSAGNCIPTTGPYAVGLMKYYPYVNRIAGNGEYNLSMGSVNAGYEFSDTFSVYAFGSYSVRNAQAFENVRLPTQNIATPGSNQPCSAANPQGYNTAQTTLTGGSAACAIGINTGSGLGVAVLRGSAAATPGVNSSGIIISSGQAGTLFTPGELVQYPNGMYPKEALRETDFEYTVGTKFNLATIDFDAALGYGKDFNKIYTLGSGNRSLFIDTHVSPKNFYDGSFTATQLTATLNAEKTFNVGLASPLNVAVGVEAREDLYGIGAGDPTSYYKEGAQSFPGYSPTVAGNHSRKNYSGYVDLSVAPVEELVIDLAGRFEHFTDFGDAKIAKITARYDFSPMIAFRGTISTGFRAPTLAEEFYTAVNVSPTSATVQLAANSAAAKVLGLPDLKPEISTQYSAGVVLHPFESFSATIDVYSTALGNRIVGSSTVNSSGGAINTPLVTTAVTTAGVTLDPTATQQGVSAFYNGLSTLTQGIDVMMQYYSDLDSYGIVNWIASGNYNDTAISKVAPPPALLLASNPSATFFTFQSLYNFRHSTPNLKIGLSADWTLGDFAATLRETIYGSQHTYTSPNSGGVLVPWNQPSVALTDFELRYTIPDSGLQLSLGGNNIFNIRAKGVPFAPSTCTAPGVVVITAPASCAFGPNNASGQAVNANNGSVIGAPFGSAFSPNGGYYYTRLSYKL